MAACRSGGMQAKPGVPGHSYPGLRATRTLQMRASALHSPPPDLRTFDDSAMRTPPPAVTPEQFAEWRSPRRGLNNPQPLSNAVWAWLVHSRLSAFQANESLHGPSSFEAGPGWCFERFGQSRTYLPDGRLVCIAGEHEDYYDPDFYIYNDVVVMTETGEISIFAYPEDLFPPTDFHSATLMDGVILLIGNLGYPKDRRPGHTQVLRLDPETWKISALETYGDMPGWIHEHCAAIAGSGHEIIVTGGRIDRCDGLETIENLDDWCLDTRTWHWTRLSHRDWTRFQLFREDRHRNHLWEMRQLLWSKSMKWHDIDAKTRELTEALGAPPDLDLLTGLYAPAIATAVLGEDPDDFGSFRIHVDDVVVRYQEDDFVIQVTVEGIVPAETLDSLKNDMVRKLSALERVPVICAGIEPQ